MTIILPQKTLIEQVNLQIRDHHTKKQSNFSKNYALLTIIADDHELPLKSAYSECVTRQGKLEYNPVGVTQKLELIFARDKQAEAVDLDLIKIE